MKKYKKTLIACLMGIFAQAVASNMTAILFVPIMTLYDLSYVHLGILVAVNFTVQIMADLIFGGLIDRIGYRKLVLPACGLIAAGLLVFACAPLLPWVFPTMVFATVLFSFSCGLLEIVLSPMVAAMDDDQDKYVSLLHSFYAWGQVATILVTTLLLLLLGNRLWFIIPILWTAVPITCFLLFVKAPMPSSIPEEKRTSAREVRRSPVFLLLLGAIFLGAAAEVTMNQWASTFAEKALGMNKTTGDLLCMCGFALAMGVGRLLYSLKGRGSLQKLLIVSSFGATLCYIAAAVSPWNAVCVAAFILCGLSTALLWPGTVLMAGERFPMTGAWLYASLAVLGDTGAAIAPLITGTLADGLTSFAGGLVDKFATIIGVSSADGALRLALLLAAVFPLLCSAVHILLARIKRNESESN